jgi:hypothetical protein
MKNIQDDFSAAKDIERRLWDYLDGFSTPVEKGKIELLLEQNKEWKQKYNEFSQLQKLIQSSELEEPSMRFTKNVMEKISIFHIAPATKTYINKKVIWSIASFFIITISVFIIYAISQIDWTTDISKTVAGIDFSAINYSSVFNNTYINLFMMINVVLGLMLLESYLSGKNKQLHTRVQ